MLKYLYLLLVVSLALYGRDFGRHGNTFPIAEQDLIKRIQNKIGEQGLVIEKMAREKVEALRTPPPVKNLNPAKTYRSKHFDPSITLAQDILDAEGKIIARQGTVVNPLDHIALSDDLLFFDGSNNEHIEWAKTQPKACWILVSGSPFELENQLNRPVYFDQAGVLTEKFGIGAIPVRISQEGKRLKIEEICLGNCTKNMEQQ
jgi:conjugal transfer pilus assembly protein TraW